MRTGPFRFDQVLAAHPFVGVLLARMAINAGHIKLADLALHEGLPVLYRSPRTGAGQVR